MQKSLFSVFIAVCCIVAVVGCNKNTPYVTTLEPYMTANIGTYNFTAKTVVPAIIDTQSQIGKTDSGSILRITGNTSDLVYVNDKIELYINHFHGQTGTFSIVQGQAGAAYYHNGSVLWSPGGIVAITRITDNSLIGYFQFTATDPTNPSNTMLVSNGTFSVGNPWYFY